MPKIKYIPHNFTADTMIIVEKANEFLEDYDEQGYSVTLRQLYYRFVSEDLIENTQKSYNRLGSIINTARLAGMVDWSFMEDRTRNLVELEHFDGADDALQKLASWYHVDMWERQPIRPEVWVEKDALVGVVERICQKLDVPFFSCRGYTSQSEMWNAGQRMQRHVDNGQEVHVIHLGDHDPSGIDMSRDITDRLKMFMGGVEFRRIALNMDQIERYGPPPNPAKITDSRAKEYIKEYGESSWELDALTPSVLTELIRNEITFLTDHEIYQEDVERASDVKQRLVELARNWNDEGE